MKMSADQFATVVRGLPLTTGQAAVAEDLLAGPPTKDLPRELVRREVLTEYQARLILAGRAADLTVGRYALLEPLGEGGMGQVFKARDTGMDRVVALKLIRDDRLGNAAAVKRFEQEVKAAARLAHPNIVRAYDAGTGDGKHFLVTELVAGHDLGRDLARRGRSRLARRASTPGRPRSGSSTPSSRGSRTATSSPRTCCTAHPRSW